MQIVNVSVMQFLSFSKSSAFKWKTEGEREREVIGMNMRNI